MRPGKGVDVVADASTYGEVNSFDLVICCEVLEHTPLGKEICHNAYRILRRGGNLLLSCATDPRHPHSGIDPDAPVAEGEHYANVSEEQLREWLRDFTTVKIYKDVPGDLYAVARVGY